MTLYEMDEKNNYYSEVIKKRTTEKPKYNHAILNDSVAQESNTDHYPKVVNGYWYVYDPLMGGFVSTGIKASVTEPEEA